MCVVVDMKVYILPQETGHEMVQRRAAHGRKHSAGALAVPWDALPGLTQHVAVLGESLAQHPLRVGQPTQHLFKDAMRLAVGPAVGEALRQPPRRGEAVRVVGAQQRRAEAQVGAQERLRLGAMAKRKMRRLESGGVELDMLQLVTSCHLLLEPPPEDAQEERIWCIDFFRGKMYDFVVRICRPESPSLAPFWWPSPAPTLVSVRRISRPSPTDRRRLVASLLPRAYFFLRSRPTTAS